MSQPAVRLPAVKVTLPAAMDYTGAHSQAEYNIALEGSFEARAGRDEPSGTSGPHPDCHYDNLATTSQVLKGRQQKDRAEKNRRTYKDVKAIGFKFMSPCPSACRSVRPSVCLSYARRISLLQVSMAAVFSPQECVKKEPAGIRTALMGQQQSKMSHKTPSRHKRKSNPVVFIRGYQRAFKRAFIPLFSSLNSKGIACFIRNNWRNEGQFFFEWDRSHLTTALSGAMPLFRGREETVKVYAHTYT